MCSSQVKDHFLGFCFVHSKTFFTYNCCMYESDHTSAKRTTWRFAWPRRCRGSSSLRYMAFVVRQRHCHHPLESITKHIAQLDEGRNRIKLPFPKLGAQNFAQTTNPPNAGVAPVCHRIHPVPVVHVACDISTVEKEAGEHLRVCHFFSHSQV